MTTTSTSQTTEKALRLTWVLPQQSMIRIAADTAKVVGAFIAALMILTTLIGPLYSQWGSIPNSIRLASGIWLAAMTFGASVILNASGQVSFFSGSLDFSVRLVPTTLTLLVIAGLVWVARKRNRDNQSRDQIINESIVVAGTAFVLLYITTFFGGMVAGSIGGEISGLGAQVSASVRPGFISLLLGSAVIGLISTVLGSSSIISTFGGVTNNAKLASWAQAIRSATAALVVLAPATVIALLLFVLTGKANFTALLIFLLDAPVIALWMVASVFRVPFVGDVTRLDLSLLWFLAFLLSVGVMLLVGATWHLLRDKKGSRWQEGLKTGSVLAIVVGVLNMAASFRFSGGGRVMGISAGGTQSIMVLANPLWLAVFCVAWGVLVDVGGSYIAAFITPIAPQLLSLAEKVGVRPSRSQEIESKEINVKKPPRRVLVRTALVVAVIAALFVGFKFLSSKVGTPKAAISTLSKSLQNGDVDGIVAVAPLTSLSGIDVSLLQGPGRMTTVSGVKNLEVVDMLQTDDTATVQISYVLDNKLETSTLYLAKTGKKRWGFLSQWVISDGFYGRMTLPDYGSLPLKVNGALVKADGQNVAVVPGIQKLSVANKYVTGSTDLSVGFGASEYLDEFTVTLVDAAQESIFSAVGESLSACAAQATASPNGCPFGYSFWFSSPESVKWQLIGSPTTTITSVGPGAAAFTSNFALRISGKLTTGRPYSQDLGVLTRFGQVQFTEPLTVEWR